VKRALITGITGQDGYYLSKLLISKGYQVTGLIRGQNNPRASVIKEELPEVELVSGDLLDVTSLIRILQKVEPDEIYNLAAISFVAYSWDQALLTSQVTGMGVANLLEAIRIWVGQDYSKTRFYQASSSEMFGKVQEVPQKESTQLWPRSPYGASKAFGHFMTVNYRESYGLHASSGILFNHESPRRGEEFVTRKISKAVARIATGQQKVITLGNLDAKRDWGFAGDYVDAMHKMVQADDADDYVIATGVTHSIRDFLDEAFRFVNISDWSDYVEISAEFMRPSEVELLIGDYSKASSELKWGPTTSFSDLVKMMVQSDLERCSRSQ
jgi:GDPmannose 4,6-dehydratase